MKVEHLTNKAVHTLHDELTSALKEAHRFSIATAFIDDTAITLVKIALDANSPISGRILTGLYNNFNRKVHLERLLQLTLDYPDRLQVHISLDRCFHWKFYQFTIDQKNLVYIGSANFTKSGMTEGRELIVKLSDRTNSSNRSLQNLANSFEKEWTNSRSLSEFPLEHYREAKLLKTSTNDTHQTIKNFFNKKSERKIQVADSGKAYAVGLYVDAKPPTIKAINNQKSEWLKNRWDWFVASTLLEFKACHNQRYIFVFSKEGRNDVYCYYSEIMDSDSNIKTPDGKYFIAYKTIKQKKLSRKLLDILRQPPFNIDLIGWKNPFSGKTFGKNQAKTLIKVLGIIK